MTNVTNSDLDWYVSHILKVMMSIDIERGKEMSTRSRICFVENGKYVSCYCHFDGYEAHNGRILYGNYTDLNKVKDLVLGGDFRSLEENISNIERYDDGNEPLIHDSIKDLLEYMNESDQEFLYVFEINPETQKYEWKYYDRQSFDYKFVYEMTLEEFFKGKI